MDSELEVEKQEFHLLRLANDHLILLSQKR